MHSLAIALHQHLTYACCASEVAIYLERWMGIKEVRVGATATVFAVLVDFRAYVGEQLAVYLISFVGRRAQRLILQPVLQPVELSPLISRVLVAAAASSGVLFTEI